MNKHAIHIKKGRKFDQVLAGARSVFMEQGYEGASVDDIARAANVSKATLYSYFPNKESLFTQVAIGECLNQADRATAEIDLTAPVAEVLRAAANHLLGFFLSDFGISIYRICVAESGRFPDLGRHFYETGPARAKNILTSYLAQATERGELQIAPADLTLAAHQFVELCRAGLFHRRLFFVQTEFTPAERDQVAQGATDMFLAHYKARPELPGG